jgi:hypothetical protein
MLLVYMEFKNKFVKLKNPSFHRHRDIFKIHKPTEMTPCKMQVIKNLIKCDPSKALRYEPPNGHYKEL